MSVLRRKPLRRLKEQVLKNTIGTLGVLICTMLLVHDLTACSMYKITTDGKTMVGCNYDAWFTTPKIWFENARTPDEYGAGFTGAREVSNNRTAPQSGMNEAGLAFSRLVAYYPAQENPFRDRLVIADEAAYLSDILHTCANVEEAREYIERFDHSIFLEDVFIYVDGSGKYLIVEPYQIISGDDASYLLSNFCPSITDNEQARKLERFRNGEDFLSEHTLSSSLSFCRSLSDTMHVCRNKKGDGTLLTSIWDTKERLLVLYFYHSYDQEVRFDLTTELSKGDHVMAIPELFPENAEFEELKSYKTPFNTPELRITLALLGAFLSITTLYFVRQIWRNRHSRSAGNSLNLVAGLNILLTGYLFILATNVSVFYFDAPYKHYSSGLISASSYIPFLVLLAIVPVTRFTIRNLRAEKRYLWFKMLLVTNNLIYFILLIGFGYWGLFTFWKQ